jgi:ATP-dependent Lon protease
MLPSRNKKDLEDVPEATREQVNFVWLDRVDDAVAAALEPTERGGERKVAEHTTPPSGRQAAHSA